ncbi:hypothetical protein BDF20DRAFT_825957 [Mycotypha africana]|uniref:uncharacterized protein n=1 Tax=Mycotypha africana TaxID=64632 RepID=UPI0022FFE9E7|nr:uncharacterized protein BDF20DRAFT_825957 [Mycotypha africana]KAI8970280.1 hypothetical protein BDF20DRAFT_825957 [Mycotypha africana]
MSTSGKTFLQRLRLAYKTTQFPWKKHALVGYDLKGNEYWECPNPLGGRMKRWVQMADKADNDITVFHHNKLPVLWQSWLRHTRDRPPTIAELIQDEKRVWTVQSKAKELEEAWEKLKKMRTEEEKEAKRALDEAAIKEELGSDTAEPSGFGDTFTPGEWNPVSTRR